MPKERINMNEVIEELHKDIRTIPTKPDGYRRIEETTSNFHNLNDKQRADANRKTYAKRPAENKYQAQTLGSAAKRRTAELNNPIEIERTHKYSARLAKQLEEKKMARKLLFTKMGKIFAAAGLTAVVVGSMAGMVGYMTKTDQMVQEYTQEQLEQTQKYNMLNPTQEEIEAGLTLEQLEQKRAADAEYAGDQEEQIKGRSL